MQADPHIRARLIALEAEARTHPRRHAARLWALLALGYLYPVSLLLLSAGAALAFLLGTPFALMHLPSEAIIVYLGLVVGSLALASFTFPAFFTRLREPEGLEVSRTDAPGLWALLDTLCQRLGARCPHSLRLSDDFNASASQRTRYAFGFRLRSTVTLGLPLLAALTPAELESVLAHELAHLRSRHNSLGVRTYRLYQTWQSLSALFARSSRLRFLSLGWFVRWYSRHLAITTLPIRRVYEFEADRVAAAAVGNPAVGNPALAANTLIRLEWTAYRLSRSFFPALWRLTPDLPIPPADVLARIQTFLVSPPPQDQYNRWLAREHRCRTPIGSDHPSLCERLNALTQSSALDAFTPVPRPAEHSALPLLGPLLDRALKLTNARIKARMIESWRSRHEQYLHLEKQQKPPHETPPNTDGDTSPTTTATAADVWSRLVLRLDRLSTEDAVAAIRAFLAEYPNHANGHYSLGQLLLRQDDDAGLAHLETALHNDSELIGPALAQMLAYFRDVGRDDEAEPIRLRLEAFERDFTKAKSERISVRRSDVFQPHALPPRELELLRRLLYRFPSVLTAHLVCKKTKLFADKPTYVLAITRRSSPLESNRTADKQLAAALTAAIPLSCAVVLLPRLPRSLRRKLLTTAPTPIFDAATFQLSPL